MIISQYMTPEHRECDTLFAQAEALVADGDWEQAETAYLHFADTTLLHFKKEEETIFPAFEAQTGSAQGPTQVMVFEHAQVRSLIGKMAEAIENKDKDAYLSLAESMMILLQQHNMKEEQMLYAMTDRVLPREKREEILATIKETRL